MSLGSDVALLKEAPFFAGFSEDHLRLIAFSAESRTLREGEVVVEAGRPLHSAYLVASGALRALPGRPKEGKPDMAQAIALERGALIGELALITEMRAHETVLAAEPSVVLQIRRSVFRRLFEEYPEIAEGLRQELTRALTETVEQIRRVGRRLETPGD
ncbi:Crp/Fnr family transcriptional regulator [Afifella pfennigii]|uniref:Crp/Fnr family transcriptional regulator n=1 Tax=Afifella pfennigii TaxID=209897 RepID=UPI00068C473D|nr:cyclic nucleotide-binding domain-containing protein [Afifella pfennigii]